MSNSINTNISAYFAQANIATASSASSSSVARLSSGNRIVKASDDVAALSTGTSLRTQVLALKTALTNASQGTSLLQVADGALSQVTEILQRQKAISLQAGSGSLTDTDRGYLDQEFQALSAEIDRLTGATNFNGVKLLNGSLAQAAVVSDVTSNADAANTTLALVSNLVEGDAIVINGVTLTAKASPTATTDFQIGLTSGDTIANLATKLSTLAATTTYSGSIGKATFSADGATLSISSRVGGSYGSVSTINVSGVTGDKASVGGKFAGSTVNMFATGFTNSTSAIAATTSTDETPFQVGDTITATVGDGATKSLYTIVSGDSLSSIANGINANSSTTGISASVTYSSASSTYNIQLRSSSPSDAIAIIGGAHFYNGETDDTPITHALNGATSTQNLFTDKFSAGITATAPVNSSASAAVPFTVGERLSVSVGGGAFVSITDALASTDTMTTIVDQINGNANAKALGITATLISTGGGTNNNIKITYSDSTQAKQIAFDGGDSFYNTDATGDSATNGLNSSYSSIQLFNTGFAASNTSLTLVVGGAQSITQPFTNTDVLRVTVPGLNSGNPISIATLATGDTLDGIAAKINAHANSKTYGIHAEVFVDDSGRYNMRLNVASSTAASSLLLDPGNHYGTGVANSNSRLNLTDETEVTLGNAERNSNLLTDALSATLTAGASVTAATSAAATPFQNGNTIVLTTADGTTYTTAALATGDTLAAIVTKINAVANITSTGGIRAELSADGKNIVFSYNDSASSRIVSINGGANFYNVGTSATNSGINTAYTTINLFTTGFAATSTQVAAASPTASTPIDSDDGLTIDVNGAGAITIATAGEIGANATLQEIADAINSNAVAITNKVHASVFLENGLYNIKLSVGTAPVGNPTIVIDQTTTNATLIAAAPASTTAVAAAVTSEVDIPEVAEGTGATHLTTFGLANGKDNGLGYGSVTVSGSVGADSVLTNLNQTSARVSIGFPDIADANLTDVGNFNSDGSVYLTVAGKQFAFTTNTGSGKADDEITIGATLKETLDNAVSTINSYLSSGAATGNTAYVLNQLDITRDGNNLVIKGKGISDVTNIDGTAAAAISITGFTNGAPVSNSGLLNNSSRNGSSTFGVDVSGINNEAFSGTVSGFSATYISSNTASLSITVGGFTYTASNVNTLPTAGAQTVRFYSSIVEGENGGFFDVQIAQNQGTPVSGQSDADLFATRLDAAFSGLDFRQSRIVSSYNGTQSTTAGSLIGSKVSAQLPSFAANKLTDITITAPTVTGGDASISLTIDGVKYVSKSGIGGQLGANQTFRFTSVSDTSSYVDFTTGDSALDISTSANAKLIKDALSSAFGSDASAGALSFQIGSSSTDTLNVSIGSAQTSTLFNGLTLNVLTQDNAVTAGDQLDKALAAVTTLRASVGALQSRFNFASANIQIAVQNQDAARGELLDTDVATESTAFATSQVKLQAGISVLAQANQQLQNLLKLIQ